MGRWCWVNIKCRCVLLIWIRVGQGPTALAVGKGGGCLDIFLSYIISLFFPTLSGRRPDIDLKYCPKGQISLKQQTNHLYTPHSFECTLTLAEKTTDLFVTVIVLQCVSHRFKGVVLYYSLASQEIKWVGLVCCCEIHCVNVLI